MMYRKIMVSSCWPVRPREKYSLNVPMAGMLKVYQALVSTRFSDSLIHLGSATLNPLLMEKAYRSISWAPSWKYW